jgi:hypothetical protein
MHLTHYTKRKDKLTNKLTPVKMKNLKYIISLLFAVNILPAFAIILFWEPEINPYLSDMSFDTYGFYAAILGAQTNAFQCYLIGWVANLLLFSGSLLIYVIITQLEITISKTVKQLSLLGIMLFAFNANAFHAKITISVWPKDAYIYVDGELKGAKEFTIDLRKHKTQFTIRVEKSGYATKIIAIGYNAQYPALPYYRGKNTINISLDEKTVVVGLPVKPIVQPTVDEVAQKPTKSETSPKQTNGIAPGNKELIGSPTWWKKENDYDLKKMVYSTNAITFYGYDFSHMKFIEPKRSEQGERIPSLIEKWTRISSEGLEPKHFERMLSVDTVVCNYDLALAKSKTTNETQVMAADKITLNPDSIQNWLFKYKFKGYGVGYMVFVNYFSKPDKETQSTFVFFDIASGWVLLQQTYANSGADGYGLPMFWAEGLVDNVRHYQTDVFKKEKKQFNKN